MTLLAATYREKGALQYIILLKF